MIRIRHARVHHIREFQPHANAPLGRLDLHPLPFRHAPFCGRLGVKRHDRIRPLLPGRRNLPLFGVVHGHEAASRDENQGILFRQPGIACGTVEHLPVHGQGLAAQGLKGARPQFHLARGGPKPQFLILFIFPAAEDTVLFHQLFKVEPHRGQTVIPHRIHRLPRPVFCLTEPGCQSSPEVIGIASLIEGVDSPWTGHTEVLGMPQFCGLHGGADGKDIVGQSRRRGKIVFSHHVKLQRLQGLVGLSHIGQGQQGITRQGDGRLHRIGVFSQHALEDRPCVGYAGLVGHGRMHVF